MSEYERHMARRPKYDGEHWTDTAELDAAGQFKPWFHGPRIKVAGPWGTRFGTVGMTTGWRPAFLLMHRSSDIGSSDLLGPDDHVVAVQRNGRYVPVTS